MTKQDPQTNGGNNTDRFETSMLEGILATLQNPERQQIFYYLQDQSGHRERNLHVTSLP